MDGSPPTDPEKTVFDTLPKGSLVVQSGPATGQQISLQGEVRLGRNRSNSMVFLDKKVSRYHAKLIPIDETYVITDLGSSNGTYVNGVRIGQPVRLNTGDLIRIGDSELEFYQGEVPAEVQSARRARKAPRSTLAGLIPTAPILDSQWLTSSSRSQWFWFGCGVAVLAMLAVFIALVIGLLLGQNLA
jgi:pSer/pThr/pTyr-binding forkhead associated (FHA) protein